jgi:parallel beta-helix repeat protein/predicted outer membrane repeat protein
MTNTEVSGNSAEDGGGGLWIGGEDVTGGEVTATISGSTISGNTAGSEGGGIYAYYVGSMTITNTTISANTAEGDGGGGLIVFTAESVTVTGSTITGNSSAGYGGGIYFEGVDDSATIAFTTISDNTAGEGGGGIEWYSSDGTLQLRNSTVSGNSTAAWGGGLYVATSGGPVEIFNSTISGNTASEEGGAINFSGYYGLTIVQSTITGNTATTVGGVNIDSDDTEQAAEKADRIAEHRAERAEELVANGKEPRAAQPTEAPVRPAEHLPVVSDGSIIALNSGDDVGDEGVLEAVGSILGTVTGTTVVDQGGNQFGVNPLLGPLADNGGSTQTHELLPGSPAIDTGPDPVADFPGNEDDQRGPGYARVVNGRVDIGAFEIQPPPELEPTFTG